MADEFGERNDQDPALGRLLRGRLPRYPAPPSLRAAVVQALEPEIPGRPWWAAWLAPAASALATAMVALLWLMPSLPPAAPDPLQPLTRAVLNEHARNVLWGAARPEVVPAVLPRAMEESGVAFNWVFLGDPEIQLVDAKATYLDGRRAISLAYRDAYDHAVTYVMLPAGSLVLPDRGRVQIDRWRPVVRRENGFSLIIWRQANLLCVLVSDLVSDDDLQRFKQYFVKVRSSTEPYIW
jgi:hypothetical protein